MALTQQQISELDATYTRPGGQTATDLKNIDYAKTQGYTAPNIPSTINAEDLATPTAPVVPQMTTPQEAVQSSAQKVTSAGTTNQYANLIKQIETATPAEATNTSLTDQLKSALEQAKGKGADLVAEQEKLGVSTNTAKLNELNQQIAQLQAGLNLGLAKEEARPVARQFMAGRQAEMTRQATAEIGALSTVAQALQGNIALAKQTAKDTVDLKYADKEQEIENIKTLIELNYKQMTLEQQKKADKLLLQKEAEQNAIDAQKEEDTFKNNLAIEYLKNGGDADGARGIIEAKDKNEAIISAAEFIQAPNTQIIDVGGHKWVYDANTQKLVKDLGLSDASTPKLESIEDSMGNKIYGIFDGTTFNPVSVPKGTTMDNTDLVTSVTQAINSLGLTKDARAGALQTITNAISTGDIEAAKSSLEALVKNNANATEIAKYNGWDSAYSALEQIETALSDYEKAGGDTGFWKGLSEKQLQKIGQTTDTELARIKSKIALAIINYRSNVSGAAFTESEKAEYENVFPSIGNTSELNKAKIDSLKESFAKNKDNYIRKKVGTVQYDKIFGNTPTSPQLPPLSKRYNTIDELIKENKDYQSLYSDILIANPNLTDDEVLQEIYDLQSFNNEGQTSIKTDVSKIKDGSKVVTSIGGGTATGIQGGSSAWKYGFDFVLSGGKGAKVPAPVGGEVVFAGNAKTPGNQVRIRMPNGEEMWISHLDSINVKKGQKITAKTIIGTQGNTGLVLNNKGQKLSPAEVASGRGTHLDITMKKSDGTYYTSQEVASLLGTKLI